MRKILLVTAALAGFASLTAQPARAEPSDHDGYGHYHAGYGEWRRHDEWEHWRREQERRRWEHERWEREHYRRFY